MKKFVFKKNLITLLATATMILLCACGSKSETSQISCSALPETKEEVWTNLNDEDYAKLIKGNLTKKQLEFMLSYGPGTMTQGNIDNKTLSDTLISICDKFTQDDINIQQSNQSSDGIGIYSTKEINNLFSVFKDNAFTDDFEQGNGIVVNSDQITVSLVTIPWNYGTTITSAKYCGDKMEITYDISYIWNKNPGMVYKWYQRTAYLEKQESGQYQIKDVKSEALGNWKQLYLNVLEDIKTEASDTNNSQIEYSLYDMNTDNIPELIINTMVEGWGECTVYKITEESDGVEQIQDYMNVGVASSGGSRAELLIPNDGNGLYECDSMAMKPDVYVYRVTISDGSLLKQEETTLVMDTESYNAFYADLKTVEWKGIEDIEALSNE